MIKDNLSKRERRRVTKEAQQKEARRLIQRDRELWDIERKGREKRELEEPVFMGWERYFVVRYDLRKSPEGPYLDRILSLLQNVEQCDKDSVRRERNYRKGGKMRIKQHRLKLIEPNTYWAMTEKMRRYFDPIVFKRKNFRTKKTEVQTLFVFSQPWKFVTKVREKWKTHEVYFTVNVDEERKLNNERLYGPRGSNGGYEYRHFLRWIGDNYDKWDRQGPFSPRKRMPAPDDGG